ncbi:MAG: cysteine--tRNA ligase [Deltaproteobacteria bacterium]|nr:MAG: cysteine--tRNA ligase [Deltaproteobacteria bacterium]
MKKTNPAILNTIGNTPLVLINHLTPNPRVKIYAKLEYFNPSGSIKDRAALYMIEAGETSGELTPEKTVIEATSGNTGIGLALVCAVKGYRLLLTMSESVSTERQKILRARGADILLTPARMGTDGAIEEAYRLARENPDKFYLTDQFNNPANWQAHYETTAVEIWEQTAGEVSAVVVALGTSGTVMGIQRRLKEFNSRISIVGVEPYLGHKIQGLKNMMESYRPEIFEKDRLDQKMNIDDDRAFEMTRQLARKEGLLVGMSSGAAMAAACDVAESLEEGLVVAVFPDGGERYLSTSVFTMPSCSGMDLFNTMTGRKEPFTPLIPDKVDIYSCGPTVAAPLHVGQYRRYVFSDLLSRYLRSKRYVVRHITNITDFDDRTIEGSFEAGEDLKTFTDKNTARFKKDLEILGIAPADRFPRTSEHLPEMVRLAEKLVDKGAAYEKLRSIYFNISRFSGYGELSGVDIGKIRIGATVDLDEYEKDNPKDFTLLKRSRLSELRRGIRVRTSWGNTRPSLHLQCAAIAMKYLGESFDIHTGSRELVFPHHENESAIAGAVTGQPLAHYWLHSEQVIMADGNHPTLPELTDLGFSGREIRYWLLSSHYRKPLVFTLDALRNARRSLARIDHCTDMLKRIQSTRNDIKIDQLLYDLKHGFSAAMDDDLNSSTALGAIFKVIRQINTLNNQGLLGKAAATLILERFKKIDTVLNILDGGHAVENPKARQLIHAHKQARKAHDFARADAIRDQLRHLGIQIRDKKITELNFEEA